MTKFEAVLSLPSKTFAELFLFSARFSPLHLTCFSGKLLASLAISDEPKPIDPHSIYLFYTHWANMTPIPNTLVVFGANPDSFYLGHGRRHSFQNMPDAFAKQVQGVELPITQTSWISFNPTGTKFIARNEGPEAVHVQHRCPDLITHIKDDGVAFATLGIDDSYFVKHRQGGWHRAIIPVVYRKS
ncbi:hypothetical protein B0H14DRAFT_3139757 [Mycena olivaceomarginata]|nr:hypothetical protein B0H14DRAFT_3139757 [Mycena olivaceomarginata]